MLYFPSELLQRAPTDLWVTLKYRFLTDGNPAILPTTQPPIGNDEQTLLADVIAGKDSAFIVLISRYQPLMQAVARAIIGDAFAEDVVQEAWVSVYRSVARFEGRSSLKTWIMRIVSNEAKSRLRRESRQSSLDVLEQQPAYLTDGNFKRFGHWQKAPIRWHNESPDSLLEQAQLQKCIKKTLALLPPRQKAVFTLRDIERYSFEDICDILAISAANVRVLAHRARVTLMQVIDHYQETGEC